MPDSTNRLHQFWSAVGASITEKEPVDAWIAKIISNGSFLRRELSSHGTGAFFWDMGRGIELWLYVAMPPGSAEPDPDDINITYVLPAYRGETVVSIGKMSLEEEKETPDQWWIEGTLPKGHGLSLLAPVVNFIEKGEQVVSQNTINLIVSGIVLSAQPAPETAGDGVLPEKANRQLINKLPPARKHSLVRQVPELLLCPQRGAPTLLRGIVTDVRQAANFHTGEVLLKVGLNVLGTTIDLVGPKEVFPKDMSRNQRMDMFAFLMTFVP